MKKIYQGPNVFDDYQLKLALGLIFPPPPDEPITNNDDPVFDIDHNGDYDLDRRLAALSSKLAITTGQAALKRAALSGNPLGNSQASLSLANQSIDAGVSGVWVSLSNNNPLVGGDQGTSNNMQIGQDMALSPDIMVGVSASHSALVESHFGSVTTSQNRDTIAGNFYALYSPGNLRVTAHSGLQSGAMDKFRIFPSLGNEMTYGHSNFTGSSSELSLGYELGKDWVGNNFSLIPSFAVGHRSQTTASYNERATDVRLAFFVPEMAHRQVYAALKLDARAVVKLNNLSLLPMVGIEFDKNDTKSNGRGAFDGVALPDAQLGTSLDTHHVGTRVNYHLALDLIGSDASGLALRTEYQGELTNKNAVNRVSFGLKSGF